MHTAGSIFASSFQQVNVTKTRKMNELGIKHLEFLRQLGVNPTCIILSPFDTCNRNISRGWRSTRYLEKRSQASRAASPVYHVHGSHLPPHRANHGERQAFSAFTLGENQCQGASIEMEV